MQWRQRGAHQDWTSFASLHCGSRGREGETSARKCEERCVEVQPKRLSLSGDPKVPPKEAPFFGEENGGVSCGAALGEWRLMPRDLPALTSLAISGDLFLSILPLAGASFCALTLSIGLRLCLSLCKAKVALQSSASKPTSGVSSHHQQQLKFVGRISGANCQAEWRLRKLDRSSNSWRLKFRAKCRSGPGIGIASRSLRAKMGS